MSYQETERDFYITYIFDEYKSVHGIRPRWIDFNSMSLSELKDMADKLEAEVVESIRQDAINKAQWEASVWFHRLMVEEARRSPEGVVYPNPDWDEWETQLGYGSFNEYRGIIGAELYYFNKSFSNNMEIS